MKLAEIKKLKTINKAYKTLLPIVQKNAMPNYKRTKEDISTDFIFNNISIEKTSPKKLRNTLEEIIERSIRIAKIKNITLY